MIQLRRNIRKGDVGGDVLAVSRAMRSAGIRRRRPSRTFGRYLKRDVKRFQRKHHLHADGVVGPETIKRIAEARYHHHKILDGYGRWLIKHGHLGHIHKPTPQIDTRHKIVKFVWYSYANSSLLGYLQQRPMLDLRCPPQINTESDCSEWATNAYWCAGAPDPSGYAYQGWGNTDTMQQNPAGHDPGAFLQPGDLVFYSNPGHVVVYTGGGMALSHGSPGVYYIQINYRTPAGRRAYL